MKKREKIGSFFLDILYPRHCPVCHDVAVPRGQKICIGCREKLKPISGPRCFQCSKPLNSQEQEYCGDCQKIEHSFEQGIGIFPYSAVLQESLYRLKYGKRQEYGIFYGEFAAFYAESLIRKWRIQKLIPIPLHRKRMEQRGFNQAELIARALGNKLGIPVDTGALERKRSTSPQKELDPGQRRQNLRDAFQASASVRGATLLLVDDIYTTGSTMDMAALALKKAGAEKIFFLVIAIGGDVQRS